MSLDAVNNPQYNSFLFRWLRGSSIIRGHQDGASFDIGPPPHLHVLSYFVDKLSGIFWENSCEGVVNHFLTMIMNGASAVVPEQETNVFMNASSLGNGTTEPSGNGHSLCSPSSTLRTYPVTWWRNFTATSWKQMLSLSSDTVKESKFPSHFVVFTIPTDLRYWGFSSVREDIVPTVLIFKQSKSKEEKCLFFVPLFHVL